MSLPPRLHVEVALQSHSTLRREEVKNHVRSLLLQCNSITPGACLTSQDIPSDSTLQGQVRFIQLCDTKLGNGEMLHPASTKYIFHIYKPDAEGSSADNAEDGDESAPPSTHWNIPCEDFIGLWESLVFESNVKEQLLSFVETAALYSDRGVNTNIINWNRVVLLHGPPGTGKTSLCKALAQKLSIRLDGRYKRAQLVEINSHSLFSKWFSESGKLVMKMFNQIKEIAEDPDALVCVLIDEVESLTHARKAAMNGVEPSDSIRVVNAVLTQIDQMQRYPNVLMLTTSNMTGAIDLAFVDRADIKRYIGLPSTQAIYKIYHTCLEELMNKGIIIRQQLFNYNVLERCNFVPNDSTEPSMKVLKLAEKSKGLSGRSLRKIPFLSHSLYIDDTNVTLNTFLNAMEIAIRQRGEDKCESNGLEKEFNKSVCISNNNYEV